MTRAALVISLVVLLSVGLVDFASRQSSINRHAQLVAASAASAASESTSKVEALSIAHEVVAELSGDPFECRLRSFSSYRGSELSLSVACFDRSNRALPTESTANHRMGRFSQVG